MKILIAYASKTGTVRECVERLTTALKGLDVTVADLDKETPSPADFDLIVAGASVRFGRLLPSARRFLQASKDVLLTKPLCLFLCCGIAHEYEYYREVVFPRELRDAAEHSVYFGGRLSTDGLGFFEKLLVRHLRTSIAESEIEDGEYTPSLPGILPENVDRLASLIRTKLASLSE
ncbi:MAG: hypothetical protein IJW29_04150 [Clostridia bacterium]|nr:hypothetical protein [Clostridia bacterium]